MKTFLTTFLTTFLLASILSVYPAMGKTKVILASDEWCPFYCVNTTVGPGVLPEILNEAFKNSDYELEVKNIIWSRALDMANKAKINGIIGCYKEDAPDFLYPKIAPAVSRDCYYSKKQDNWKYTGSDSLLGKKVGIVNSYSYGAETDSLKITEMGKKIFIEVTGDTPLLQNIKKLDAGRLDLILENEAVINFLKSNKNQDTNLISHGCNSDKEIYFAFSPKHPESPSILKIVNNFLSSTKGKSFSKKTILKYTK